MICQEAEKEKRLLEESKMFSPSHVGHSSGKMRRNDEAIECPYYYLSIALSVRLYIGCDNLVIISEQRIFVKGFGGFRCITCRQ